jgi:TRAP-type mannitol/chloroaromatic compound transport system permease small subunit
VAERPKESAALRLARALDGAIQGLGRLVSYLAAVLIAVIVAQVAARYVLGRGFVVFEELEWHLYAVGFIIGLSFTAVRDSNIRMDLLYRNYKPRTRAWVELFSVVFLILPFVAVMLIHSYDFAHDSWVLSERSQAPLGLPFRWAIKSVLFIGLALLGLAALVRMVYAIEALRKENENGSG